MLVLLFVVSLIIFFEYINYRNDMDWHNNQRERFKKLKQGEKLKQLPAYTDSQGRTHVDVPGLVSSPKFQKICKQCEEIVRLSNKKRRREEQRVSIDP